MLKLCRKVIFLGYLRGKVERTKRSDPHVARILMRGLYSKILEASNKNILSLEESLALLNALNKVCHL